MDSSTTVIHKEPGDSRAVSTLDALGWIIAHFTLSKEVMMGQSFKSQIHSETLPLRAKIAFVTGASRGIGASVAKQLAQAGADVALNYRSKEARAREVRDEILALERRVLLLKGDITDPMDVNASFDQIRTEWGHLDVLVLNASGGLEKGKDADYAMRLNLDAQVRLVSGAIPLFSGGGRIVFVTSHLAHFYGVKPVYDGYEPVAASKKAGEEALRNMIPELSQLGIRLVVVSGDLIEGTITPKLLQRQSLSVHCDPFPEVTARNSSDIHFFLPFQSSYISAS